MVDRVYQALNSIQDMGIGLVDLGLVYGVSYQDGVVKVKLGMVAPLCALCTVPATNMFKIYETLKGLECVDDVEVEPAVDPPWTPDRMAEWVRARWKEILMEVAERFGVGHIVRKYGTLADVKVKIRMPSS